jgi:hypothetical protein
MADSSFPVQAQTQQMWDIYLHQQAPTSQDLEMWRHGYLAQTPLQSVQRLKVPVPHPLHKEYSSIEKAKRDRVDNDQKQKVLRIKIRGVEQRAPWIPPEKNRFLDSFRPNINGFAKVLSMRIPKRFY